MPNDAKLGLVVGVGLVIAMAVVFASKEPTGAPIPSVEGSTTAVPAGGPPLPGSGGPAWPPRAQPAGRSITPPSAVPECVPATRNDSGPRRTP
jgi:hypothetical protein